MKDHSPMSRQYFTKDSAQPFADAVLIDGRTLYLSGRIGLVPGTRKRSFVRRRRSAPSSRRPEASFECRWNVNGELGPTTSVLLRRESVADVQRDL